MFNTKSNDLISVLVRAHASSPTIILAILIVNFSMIILLCNR